jgi:hypothetical protein
MMTPTRTWGMCLGLGLGLTATGCDVSPREPAAALTQDPAAPMRSTQPSITPVARPDLARMTFDPETRRLSLYPPAKGGTWVLRTPWNGKGEPITTDHGFMDEVDLERTTVFYMTENGFASPAVTLREVLEGVERVAGR